MEGTFSRKLHVWENPATIVPKAYTDTQPATPALAVQSLDRHYSPGNAEQLFVQECLIPPGHKFRQKEAAEPFTLQWFLNIETQRYTRFASWIPRIMEFTKHGGETLLALGQGLGTDWAQYARNGVGVVVCSHSASQVNMVRRNFEVRNLKGRFVHAQLKGLPLETASVDVVAINAMNQAVDHDFSLDEVYRVLKPGGKVMAVATARHDIDYWVHKVLIWRNWLGLNRREYDANVIRYSRRDLSRLFAQYVDQRTHRRQLRRSEAPHGWRWLPLPILTRIAGRLVIFKGFKPLSVVLPLTTAA